MEDIPEYTQHPRATTPPDEIDVIRQKDKQIQVESTPLGFCSPSHNYPLIHGLLLELQLLLFSSTPYKKKVQPEVENATEKKATKPLRTVFPIYVGNYGTGAISRAMYDYLYHAGFGKGLDPLHVQYILTMAYTYRILSINDSYTPIQHLHALKQAVIGIRLPTLLAQYVQNIGTYTLPSGTKVVPYGRGMAQLYPQGNQQQVPPSSILVRAGRRVPNNLWCVDMQWIHQWNRYAKRISHFVPMTKVDFRAMKGNAGMLVSYQPHSDKPNITCRAVSPLHMEQNKAKLNACFRYRDYHSQDNWLKANNHLLFAVKSTNDFDPNVYFKDRLVSAFN